MAALESPPDGEGAPPNIAGRIGRVSARHRTLTILLWLVFVLASWAVGQAVSQQNLTDAQEGSGPSGQATRILESAFPFHSSEEVLIQTRGAVASNAPVVRAAVEDLVARLSKLPTVAEVLTPYSPYGGSSLVSKDGHSVLVTFYVSGSSIQAQSNVTAALGATAATQRDFPSLSISEFGTASAYRALVKVYVDDFSSAEHTSLPVTLVVLLLAFGSLMAAAVPLALGLTAVVAALGLINPISHLFPVAQGEIEPVVLLIGLAVGVDYSMFYLRRQLEERRRGLDARTALAHASATSGLAVLTSGLTVLTAMAGMFFVGIADFRSLAMGTMLVVAISVVGSVTVLPALIATLGDRVEWGRVPLLSRRNTRGGRVWPAIVRAVLRVPALSAVLAVTLLAVIAAPALSMRTVTTETAGLPRGLPIMATFSRIERAFPGAPIPAVVVLTAPNVTAAPVSAAVTALGARALQTRGLAGPLLEVASSDHRVALVTLSVKGSGVDATSTAALARLRDTVIPETVGRVPGVHAYVTGLTAQSVDFNSTMDAHLLYVFVFVLGLAFVLLLVAFRSLVIPLLTIVLNVLSVGAAYGVVVLIFQRGWMRSLIGAPNVGGVVNWLPLFLFIVLFGLSMDYHVLILSRIREAHRGGLPTRDAVAQGITSTAGVITSAAVVMIAVFAIFATLSEVIYKQLGLALAVAVLIDATVVRIVLLPAAMTLLGRWNWYLPGDHRHAREPGEPVARPPAPDVGAPPGADSTGRGRPGPGRRPRGRGRRTSRVR